VGNLPVVIRTILLRSNILDNILDNKLELSIMDHIFNTIEENKRITQNSTKFIQQYNLSTDKNLFLSQFGDVYYIKNNSIIHFYYFIDNFEYIVTVNTINADLIDFLVFKSPKSVMKFDDKKLNKYNAELFAKTLRAFGFVPYYRKIEY
jgi:hypothetical protein